MDAEKLGDKLMAKGKSSMTSVNVFKGKSRYTDAIDYLERAADQFRQSGAFEKCAEALEALIECYSTHILAKGDGTSNKLAKYWEQLAEAFQACDEVKKANKAFVECALVRQGDNNFTGAGIIFKKMAAYAEENRDVKGAIDAWDAAEQAYLGASSKATAAQCQLSKGRYLAERGDYKKAAEVFKAVVVEGAVPVETLTAAFRAQLCMFVDSALQADVTDAQFYDDVLTAICERWASSTERSYLVKLMAAYQAGEAGVKTYVKVCGDFNTVYPLDAWTVSMLLKIKNVMQGLYSMSDSDDDEEAGEDGARRAKAPRTIAENVSDLLK